MQAGRHQEVARAFRARGGQDGRLEFEEALLLHPSAKQIDNLPAQHDVLVEFLAPQIKEAIPEPRILGIGLVAEHRQRQIARRPQHLDLPHVDLDEAGRHLGILGAGRALAHVAVDAHDKFRTQLLAFSESGRIRIDDALREPIMIAQIDEQQPAVVADAMAPAGEPDGGAVFREAEGAAGVGAIAVHDGQSFFA